MKLVKIGSQKIIGDFRGQGKTFNKMNYSKHTNATVHLNYVFFFFSSLL